MLKLNYNKIIILLMLCCIGLYCPASFSYELDNFAKCKVLNIVDGDTIRVEYKGKKESVRFLGIDTPESRPNKSAYKQAYREDIKVEKIVKKGKLAKGFIEYHIHKIQPEITIVKDKEGNIIERNEARYVYLEFDEQELKKDTKYETILDKEKKTGKRDRYYRLLAYVYLPNGKMLNEESLLSGHATPYMYNYLKHKDIILKASGIFKFENK